MSVDAATLELEETTMNDPEPHHPEPRCSVFIATSLDGFIAEPDGSIDFLETVEAPGEDYGYADFAATVDAIVMGRNTYDVVSSFPDWPYSKRVVVLSTQTGLVSTHGEEFYSGDVRELAARLGREGVRRIYVDGGATVRAFLAAGLIDELTISIIPVVLGEGIPLFAGGLETVALTLTDSRVFDSGLVQVRYRVVTT